MSSDDECERPSAKLKRDVDSAKLKRDVEIALSLLHQLLPFEPQGRAAAAQQAARILGSDHGDLKSNDQFGLRFLRRRDLDIYPKNVVSLGLVRALVLDSDEDEKGEGREAAAREPPLAQLLHTMLVSLFTGEIFRYRINNAILL